jgi:hypothetical protein
MEGFPMNKIEGAPDKVLTHLTVHVRYPHEVEKVVEFSDIKFIVNQDIPYYSILATSQEAAAEGRLTIRGAGLEAGQEYKISDSSEDVNVSFEIKGITEYTTDPEGILNIAYVGDVEGNVAIQGDFSFEITETIGEKRTLVVRCDVFHIMQNA